MTSPAGGEPPEGPAPSRGYTTIYAMAERDPLRAALRLGLFLGMVAVFGFAIWMGRGSPLVRTVLVAWFGLCAAGAAWRAIHWHRHGWTRGALACTAYALLFAAVAIGEASVTP